MKRVAVDDIEIWAWDGRTPENDLYKVKEIVKARLKDLRINEHEAAGDLAREEFERDPTEHAYRSKFDMWWSPEIKHECTDWSEGGCVADVCALERPTHASVFYINTSIAMCHHCMRNLRVGIMERDLCEFEEELFQ
jgi:hypothetical protein